MVAHPIKINNNNNKDMAKATVNTLFHFTCEPLVDHSIVKMNSTMKNIGKSYKQLNNSAKTDSSSQLKPQHSLIGNDVGTLTSRTEIQLVDQVATLMAKDQEITNPSKTRNDLIQSTSNSLRALEKMASQTAYDTRSGRPKTLVNLWVGDSSPSELQINKDNQFNRRVVCVSTLTSQPLSTVQTTSMSDPTTQILSLGMPKILHWRHSPLQLTSRRLNTLVTICMSKMAFPAKHTLGVQKTNNLLTSSLKVVVLILIASLLFSVDLLILRLPLTLAHVSYHYLIQPLWKTLSKIQLQRIIIPLLLISRLKMVHCGSVDLDNHYEYSATGNAYVYEDFLKIDFATNFSPEFTQGFDRFLDYRSFITYLAEFFPCLNTVKEAYDSVLDGVDRKIQLDDYGTIGVKCAYVPQLLNIDQKQRTEAIFASCIPPDDRHSTAWFESFQNDVKFANWYDMSKTFCSPDYYIKLKTMDATSDEQTKIDQIGTCMFEHSLCTKAMKSPQTLFDLLKINDDDPVSFGRCIKNIYTSDHFSAQSDTNRQRTRRDTHSSSDFEIPKGTTYEPLPIGIEDDYKALPKLQELIAKYRGYQTHHRQKRWDSSGVCGWPIISSGAKLFGGECTVTPDLEQLRATLTSVREILDTDTGTLEKIQAQVVLTNKKAESHYLQLTALQDNFIKNADEVKKALSQLVKTNDEFKKLEEVRSQQLLTMTQGEEALRKEVDSNMHKIQKTFTEVNNALFCNNITMTTLSHSTRARSILDNIYFHYNGLLTSIGITRDDDYFISDFEIPADLLTLLHNKKLKLVVDDKRRFIFNKIEFHKTFLHDLVDFSLEVLIPVTSDTIKNGRVLAIRGLGLVDGDKCYRSSFSGSALCFTDGCYDVKELTTCYISRGKNYYCDKNLLRNTPKIQFNLQRVECSEMSTIFIPPDGFYFSKRTTIMARDCAATEWKTYGSYLPGTFVSVPCSATYKIDESEYQLCGRICEDKQYIATKTYSDAGFSLVEKGPLAQSLLYTQQQYNDLKILIQNSTLDEVASRPKINITLLREEADLRFQNLDKDLKAYSDQVKNIPEMSKTLAETTAETQKLRDAVNGKLDELDHGVAKDIKKTKDSTKVLQRQIDNLEFNVSEGGLPLWLIIVHLIVTILIVVYLFFTGCSRGGLPLPYKMLLVAILLGMASGSEAKKFPGNCTDMEHIRACKVGRYDNCTLVNWDFEANNVIATPLSKCGCSHDGAQTAWDEFEECINPNWYQRAWAGVSNAMTNLEITNLIFTITLFLLVIFLWFRHVWKISKIYEKSCPEDAKSQRLLTLPSFINPKRKQ